MKILLVEDDASTSDLLLNILTKHRYTVDLAQDGEIALGLAENWEYDLILLDVGLPGVNGLAVCQRIRAKDGRIPILMLTAQDDDEDIIRGLDAGADDYVVKPYHPEQLMARIRSLLRRSSHNPSTVLIWGDLCLDPVTNRVTYQGQELTLRHKEYVLLELFLRLPRRTFSRSAILDHLWEADNCPSEAAVTNLIKDLRHKLTAAGLPQDTIQTVYGLGYRLKQGTTQPLLAQPAATQPSEDSDSALEQLAQQFLQSAQHRLVYLQESADLLQQGQVSPDRWQFVKQEIHKLAGSFGMYGYGQASDLARSLDRLLTGDIAVDKPHVEAAMNGFAELRQALGDASVPEPDGDQFSEKYLVLVISEDDAWVESLQREARHANLQIEALPDWSPAQQRLFIAKPDIITLELGDPSLDGSILEQLKQSFPQVPLLAVAKQDTLASRIAAARSGSARYLTKPISAQQLFKAMTPLLPPAVNATQGRVLIVDDDPDIHALLARWLQPWGLEITSLEQPAQFWQVLTQTNPDLLLLDIEMPTFNGIELCQVVRQDPLYNDLPILVITSHHEPDAIQQVYEAGADDLIHKPLVESELVVRVMNRIERSRLRKQVEVLRHQQSQIWQQQATTDCLTQIANRRGFDEFLKLAWQQLQREGSPLSLILCDIDEFKIYNDYYGHAAGDLCLKQIADALQKCIKPDIDQVSRYGGEELAVVLPNTPLSGAISVAERIQQEIASLKISHGSQASHPYVTLSLGISGTIPVSGKTPEDLMHLVDQALYAAKHRGRNTYCLLPM